MRWDRPGESAEMLPQALATPHARGSTRHIQQLMGLFPGYPACAGIDLCVGH